MYCTIATMAYNPSSDAMWIGHRVIQKYIKDGVWCFRTKGDNAPEPDPWEVPERFLLGVVVEIIHVKTADTVPQTMYRVNTRYAVMGVVDFIIGLFIGIYLGFVINRHGKKASNNIFSENGVELK